MSPLLNQAIAAVENLSGVEQDALAAIILDEIRDEQHWEQAFAQSGDKLRALAERAKQQVQEGNCRAVGFDEL